MNILIPMSGDLFHYGHVRLLKRVKENYPNSTITVGLISDEQMVNYKRLPIMNYDERKEVIECCRYVNQVINCPLVYTYEMLDELKIDKVIHAHNIDEDDKYYYFCKNIPNKFERYPYTDGISTTDIIERVINKNK